MRHRAKLTDGQVRDRVVATALVLSALIITIGIVAYWVTK